MRMDLKEICRDRMWTGLIWLRIGTSGGLWLQVRDVRGFLTM